MLEAIYEGILFSSNLEHRASNSKATLRTGLFETAFFSYILEHQAPLSSPKKSSFRRLSKKQ